MLIQSVAEVYLAGLRARARPRTVHESAAMLARIVAELGIETVGELSRGRVKVWRDARIAAGASNKTANNALAVLLAALACAVEDEMIDSQRRKPRALAEWEIAQLLAALADMDANPPEEQRPRISQGLLVRVLLESGSRWGELTLATWSDVDTAGATLLLRAENNKTDTERAVPIPRDTCEALVSYRLECAAVTGAMPAASDPIFLSPKGRPWTSGSNFRKILGVAYERAGLLVRDENGRLRSRDGHALNVHTLRHTCCTRLLRSGATVPDVQAMLGHASPQMTLRVYAHSRAESCRSVVDASSLHSAALVARIPDARSRVR